MIGRLRDDRDRLHAGRAGTDHRDALARELDRGVRPFSGVVGLTGERVASRDVRDVGCGEHPGREHAVARRDPVAAVGGDVPQRFGLVEDRRPHTRGESERAAQIEPVGDVFEVREDLGLSGEPFAPRPVLLQVVVERERVVHALHVAPRPGIAVVVPGSTHPGSRFEPAHRQSSLPQTVHRVHTCDAGTYDDDVEMSFCRIHETTSFSTTARHCPGPAGHRPR